MSSPPPWKQAKASSDLTLNPKNSPLMSKYGFRISPDLTVFSFFFYFEISKSDS